MRRWLCALAATVTACSLAHDADSFSSGDGTGASSGAAGDGGVGGSDSGSGGAGATGTAGGSGGSTATGGSGATGGAGSGGSGGSTPACGDLNQACCPTGSGCFGQNVVCSVDKLCVPCGQIGGVCCSNGCPGTTSDKDHCCSIPAGVSCGGPGVAGDPDHGLCRTCCYRCSSTSKWFGVDAAQTNCLEVAKTKCSGQPETKWSSDHCDNLN